MKIEPKKIIDEFGGVTAVAGLCEVTLQAVYQWRNTGIPRARLLYLKAVKPDIFVACITAGKNK